MTINILDSIINIIKTDSYNLRETMVTTNRANSMGDALEEYVLDSFSDSIDEQDEQIRLKKISDVFSYRGNSSNPPDAIIRNGAGLEVKKIESRNSQLQLNSSHPKSKLYIDNPKLTKHAVESENWSEKDFLYAIGHVKDGLLKELALIDASVYCADRTIYEDMFEGLKMGIGVLPNIQFSPTKELGRVNRVDPLGITNLRIRGMWLLENPFIAFSYVYQPTEEREFNLFALVASDKFDSFENAMTLTDLANDFENLKFEDVHVKNPNNPSQLINCKKITFSK